MAFQRIIDYCCAYSCGIYVKTPMQTAEKKLTTYRLSPTARRTIEQLANGLGLTRTGVIETAVREMRDRHQNESTANATALDSLRAMRSAARKAGIA